MNPKITRLREEHAKLKAKISRLSARGRDLEKQILALENTDIIGLVRAQGLSLEDFAELMQRLRDAAPAVTEEEEVEDAAW
ncbi:MAG: DUF4315 family protein [Oscillospiraceae bacterium]|nr:DUF4315 family protein [Oscillospiraceae bacterium]MBQ9412544.1 DUF4315 family protein [Oscillospiraceae bacterium]